MNKNILVLNLTPRWWMLHYSSQFCNELNKKSNINLKVWIASYHKSILYDKDIKFIKIRTNPNLFSFIVDTINIFSQLQFFYNIYKFKPNIIHFIDNHPWYSFYVKIFKFFWIKIYVTQHDPLIHSWESDSLLWKIAWYTNKILRINSYLLIVHWENLKKYVIKNYQINENKILSIPHWAYTFFNKWSKWLEVQKNTFLFFWRILDYKWLDILLESLEIIKQKFEDFTLIIAWPWDLEKYDKYLTKYKSNIKIYNYNIEPEDAYKFFEISEFVVLPYKDATWSWVIPVSYSFSKAVLVTNVWELSSVVLNWKTGFIIEPNNNVLLWNKIVEMLEQKNKIIEMWKNWYDFSVKNLSWKPIIDKIYKNND